jgi:hypothetical protein
MDELHALTCPARADAMAANTTQEAGPKGRGAGPGAPPAAGTTNLTVEFNNNANQVCTVHAPPTT